MKVLYLISGLGPPSGWGTEFIQNLIFELAKNDVRATILTPVYIHTHPEWNKWIREQKRLYGVRIIPLEVPSFIRNNLFLHRYITPFVTTASAFKLLTEEPFHLIHEFSSTPVILLRTLIFRICFNIPTVFTLSVYNSTFLGSLKWFKLFDCGEYYFIPSYKICKELISLGIRKRKVVFSAPGIDFRPYIKRIDKGKARKVLGLPNNKFIFAFFGDLTAEKGVVDIIQAAKTLKPKLEKRIFIVLYTIWKGSRQHPMLKSEVDGLKLPYLKVYEKFVDIPTLLAATDVTVLPQRTGFGTTIPPISVIESIIAKRFVIATNIIGNNEWADESSGVLVKPQDPKSLANAMSQVFIKKKGVLKIDQLKRLSVFRISKSISLHLSIYRTLRN